MSIIGDRVKARREQLGMSQESLGKAIGVSQQNIVHIENGRTKRSRLVLELAEVLSCSPKWLLGDAQAQEPAIPENDDENGKLIIRGNSQADFNTANVYLIDELDVRAQAGGGAMVDTETKIAEWSMPRDAIRAGTTAPAAALKIITVIGDSMEPTLMPGQRIMVDLEDTTPSPPGLFVVWDGLGQVVKRVDLVHDSDPLMIELRSDNATYKAYQRTLDEAHIRGRVVGLWRWT